LTHGYKDGVGTGHIFVIGYSCDTWFRKWQEVEER